MKHQIPLLAAGLLAGLMWLPPAHAYLGPGAGLSAIGSILAIGAAVIIAIVGFLWYPLKRLMRGRQRKGGE